MRDVRTVPVDVMADASGSTTTTPTCTTGFDENVQRGRARILTRDEHGRATVIQLKTRGMPWPAPGEDTPVGTQWRAIAERSTRGRVDPSWTGRWRSTRTHAMEQARRWIANAENTGIAAVDLERSDGHRDRLWTSDRGVLPQFPDAASGCTRATAPPGADRR